MEKLFENSSLQISNVNTRFIRSIYKQVDWNCRLIEINGARGVGKTTLLLQQARKISEEDSVSILYISLDDPFFYKNTIIDSIDYFTKYGGKVVFLDEIHKYPSKHPGYDWAAELKVVYDRYPDLKLVYSGSSVLQLYKGQGDLSRRKCTYNLPGLSFREYVNWIENSDLETISLEQVRNNHAELAKEIVQKVKIFPLFEKYLKHGYYPYYHEAPEQFYIRLRNTINVILEQDIPAVSSFANANNIKLKKLLGILAEAVPFTPNLTNLRSELYITDQRTLLNYLDALEKAELLNLLEKNAKGMKRLQKPSKIYLNNSNLLYSLYIDNPNVGMIRETFFLNQLKANHKVNYTEKGDFLVDAKFIFEIGGQNKTSKQIKGIEDAYLAVDQIEIGFGNKIPLWLFGFLY